MATPRSFSFCEHVTATGPWHIREVGPEGLKFGGGAKTSLCHAHEPTWWINGWDLEVPLEETRFSAERNQEITAQRLEHVCKRCVELYQEIAAHEEVVSAVVLGRRDG